jgi:hypothetical protein
MITIYKTTFEMDILSAPAIKSNANKINWMARQIPVDAIINPKFFMALPNSCIKQ